jgi:uncharacterized membrane protein YkvA (DUF1232 family)
MTREATATVSHVAAGSQPLPPSATSAREAPGLRSPWRFVPRLVARVMSERSQIGKSLDDLPRRMEKVARQCSLILEMVDDVRAGRARNVPLRALVIGAVALLYATNPADVVPDALPFLGSLDDLAVIALATHLIRGDLERYCVAKGHALSDYF